jgi:hypothetical protein
MAGKLKPSTNLQARIKKMMQSDEDVGKVAKASPVLIGGFISRINGSANLVLAGWQSPCPPAPPAEPQLLVRCSQGAGRISAKRCSGCSTYRTAPWRKNADVFTHVSGSAGCCWPCAQVSEAVDRRSPAAACCISCSKAHIEGEELLDFLKEAVAAVPALPPEGAEPAKPKTKRQRYGRPLPGLPLGIAPQLFFVQYSVALLLPLA